MGWGGLKLWTDRKGVCPWCLEQMVCLCLCAFWWHPLGIGVVFKHSFRGLRQICEFHSLPPSGPGLQLTSGCMYVYYRNCHWEEHVCVSIAIVSIRGETSSLILRPSPRCCFPLTSDAGFENVFFVYFLYICYAVFIFDAPQFYHRTVQQILWWIWTGNVLRFSL